MPEIYKDEDYETNNKRRFLQCLTLGLGLVSGYFLALKRHADPEDKRQYMEEMILEEQIFSYLIGSKDPE